ncbi:MAG: hypothetical protein GC159_16280 [Phycisphaera sp.]|nr:hypothetical protein [Phycisphaera sp.]
MDTETRENALTQQINKLLSTYFRKELEMLAIRVGRIIRQEGLIDLASIRRVLTWAWGLTDLCDDEFLYLAWSPNSFVINDEKWLEFLTDETDSFAYWDECGRYAGDGVSELARLAFMADLFQMLKEKKLLPSPLFDVEMVRNLFSEMAAVNSTQGAIE